MSSIMVINIKWLNLSRNKLESFVFGNHYRLEFMWTPLLWKTIWSIWLIKDFIAGGDEYLLHKRLTFMKSGHGYK